MQLPGSSYKETPDSEIHPPAVSPMFQVNFGKQGVAFPEGHAYFRRLPEGFAKEAKEMAREEVHRLTTTPKTDKEAFRNMQAEAKQTMKQSSPLSLSGNNYYSKHLYYGNKQKNSIVSHCFYAMDIDAAKDLESILPTLKEGKYQPIDMSRDNYKEKQKDGVLHFTVYEIKHNGYLFELKCEAVKKKRWRNIVEMPYSLTLKKK